jgi:hypothetical protein
MIMISVLWILAIVRINGVLTLLLIVMMGVSVPLIVVIKELANVPILKYPAMIMMLALKTNVCQKLAVNILK